jgi:sugar phosphate isomerase/epimerase
MTLHSRRAFLGSAAAASVASATVASASFANEAKKANFKLGLVTYNVPKDWDLSTILTICKSTGIAAVECRTTHKHGVEITLSADERAKVKQQFAKSGVAFWGCGSTCEFHAADKSVVKKNIEECKQFVKLVADLGGKGVKVRPNGVAKGQTVEQACEQIGKALIECGKAAADVGVEIWVEVHGSVTQLPKHMKTIMDICTHPAVGVTWNSNPTDIVDGKIDAGFELLAKHIKSCHINDLENDAKGKYPYRTLFSKLAGIGYDRYTLIEVGKAYDPVEGEKFLREYKTQWEKLVNG